MSTLKTIIPAKPRRWRKRQIAQPEPLPQMTLTAAVYDPNAYTVTLSFDHAIELSAFDPAQIEVLDGLDHQARFVGIAGTQTGSGEVRVDLDQADNYTGPDNLLNASGSTGIVSPDDGATWAGVTDLVLPFP